MQSWADARVFAHLTQRYFADAMGEDATVMKMMRKTQRVTDAKYHPHNPFYSIYDVPNISILLTVHGRTYSRTDYLYIVDLKKELPSSPSGTSRDCTGPNL